MNPFCRSWVGTGLLWVLASCAGAPAASPSEATRASRPGLSQAPPPPELSVNANDCAVISAVAKEHFSFGAENPPSALKPFGEYTPSCNWSALGLAFTPWREGVKEFVSFQQPSYDGSGAEISVSKVHGPLAAQGWTCRLRSGVAGWTVERCTTVRVS